MKPDKYISGRVIEGNYLCLLLDNGKTSFTKEEHDQYIKNVDEEIKDRFWVFDGYDLEDFQDDYHYLIKSVEDDLSYKIKLINDIETTNEICKRYFKIGLTKEACEIFNNAFNKKKKVLELKPQINETLEE